MEALVSIQKYKGAILLLSGLIAIAASFYFGAGSEGYGFLIGYGCTAAAGGAAGIVYTYIKAQKQKK